MSCCGRGGSWFGRCGITGGIKFDHTWSEGLQACEATQSKVVIDQQLNEGQEQKNGSSNRESITAAKPFAFTSSPMLGVLSIFALDLVSVNITTASASINFEPLGTAVTTVISALVDMSTVVHARVTSQGCRQMLDIAVYVIVSPLCVFVKSLFI